MDKDAIKDIGFFIFFVVFSFFILYPQDLHQLFYYDDNPIRYMIAKLWVEGKLSIEEKLFFLAYGSAEIYIPFFYAGKFMNIDYRLLYNLSSLFIFFLTSAFFFLIIPKERKNIYICFPFFMIFGIVCLKKGSLHWFVASSIFLYALISQKIDNKQKLLLLFAYLISPPLMVASILFSIIFLIQKNEKRAFALILPFIFTIPKYLLVYKITIMEIEKSLEISHKIGRDVIGATKSFAPPVPSVFFRPLILDYIDNKILGAVVYLALIRSVFTREKKSIIIFASFYVFIFISIFLFDMWRKGAGIPNLIISMLSFLFASNPFRYAPIFIVYLIVNSDGKNFDTKLSWITLLSFLISSAISFIRGEGELPNKMPREIEEVIRYINSSEAKNILIEGDIHMIEKGKLVHPIYNSHLISYIVAESDNKRFYGGIIPWELYKYNFFAGKFNYKDIENSDIEEFMRSKDIDLVLCWTEKCEKFFQKQEKKIVHFDKLKLVEVKNRINQ